MPQRHDRCRNTRNVTVMIRPPDVNDPLKPAFEFILMINNIRRKISVAAIAFFDDPVFIIAQRS